MKELAVNIFIKYKFSIFRLFIKLKFSYYDYAFMSSLSMGVFASSIVAIIVSKGGFIIAYFVVAIVSFKAMIDYNYKNRYNEDNK